MSEAMGTTERLSQKGVTVRAMKPRDNVTGLKPDTKDASRDTSYSSQYGRHAIRGKTLGERGDNVERADLGYIKEMEEGYKKRRRPRRTERRREVGVQSTFS
jgi:hypothetical protein